MKRILLFDGDILAYRASAAVDGRSIAVKHNKTGKSKIFKNVTEFKQGLKSKSKPYVPEDWTITQLQEPEEPQNAFAIMKRIITNTCDSLFADEYLVAISGKQNFRDRLLLPSKYKGNRADMLRPVLLKDCKNYLWKNHPSIVAQDEEADDVLIYKAYEEIAKNNVAIICGQDKDSNAYPDIGLFNITEEAAEVEFVTSGLGELYLRKDKVAGRGFLWFAFQLLHGDPTDNYKPAELYCKLHNTKFGEKSAYALLKDCKSKTEALDVVIGQYQKWYPDQFSYVAWDGTEVQTDHWKLLQLYFKCARMKVKHDDALDFDDFVQQTKSNTA